MILMMKKRKLMKKRERKEQRVEEKPDEWSRMSQRLQDEEEIQLVMLALQGEGGRKKKEERNKRSCCYSPTQANEQTNSWVTWRRSETWSSWGTIHSATRTETKKITRKTSSYNRTGKCKDEEKRKIPITRRDFRPRSRKRRRHIQTAIK